MKLHLLAFFSVLILTACETADGFGQDVEAGGEAISDVSNDVQQDF